MTTTKTTPIWLAILNRIAAADQRHREAGKLKSMPAERLEDMGITRADVGKAFLGDRYSRPADHAALPIVGMT